MTNKKISWEQQGKSLVLTVADGRTSQQWTVRQTHTAAQKAETFRDIAESLDPALAIEPLPYYPPERAESIPQQGPVPPPVLGGQEPFVSRYEPSQGVPSVIPADRAEAESLEALKERAYKLAQSQLGLVREGAPSDVEPGRLPEVNPAGGNSNIGGMPQLAPATTPDGGFRPDQKVRQRPDPTGRNYRWEDTH